MASNRSKEWVDSRKKQPLTQEQQDAKNRTVANAIAAGCQAFGLTQQGLRFGTTQRCVNARQATILFLRDQQGFILDDLVEIFGKDRSTVISSVDNFVMKMMMDGEIKSRYLDLYANFHSYKKQDKADVRSQQVIDRTAEVRDSGDDEASVPGDIFSDSD